MELSILIAKIISIVYISAGIAIFIKSVSLDDLVNELVKSPALTFLAGCMGIIIGTISIKYHNIWTNGWTVLISIVLWFMLIGGILIIIFPKSILYYKKFASGSRYWGIFMILFGFIFGYFGFLY